VLSAVGALLVFCACGRNNPAAPTPTPVTGNYTFVVEASAVCHLPVSRYQWEVEVTASGGGGQGATMRATLPGGDASVDVRISSAASRVSGQISTRSVIEQVRTLISGTARGTVSAGPGGRGQILDGVLNGSIALSTRGDEPNDIISLGSCTAADHRWTLIPR
jgi:hypothetical protein